MGREPLISSLHRLTEMKRARTAVESAYRCGRWLLYRLTGIRTARRDSWNTIPMPREASVLSYREEFSPEDFKKISRGLIPQMMEDKWFMYLDGTTLHLHRSWTGVCVYQVEFERVAGKYVVRRALANRDPNQYRATDDDYDSQLLHFLISNLLLGKRVEYPVPGKSPNGTPQGIFQFHFSGTCYPEKPLPAKPPEPREP